MKRSKTIYFILIIVFVLILIQFPFFNPVRDGIRLTVSYPAKIIDSGYQKIDNVVSTISNIKNLSSENASLKSQLAELNSNLANLQTVQADNTQLKKDLNFSQNRSDITLSPASIINFSPNGLYGVMTVDKGSKDGVKEGQAVVSGGYLIGKINGVSDFTSEVWLITSHDVIVPVMLAKTQTTGLLRGGIQGLVVDNIPLDTVIQKGDAVVTSSLENLFPAGISVGNVEETISKKEDIFISVRVSSPINIGSLNTVFIVK